MRHLRSIAVLAVALSCALAGLAAQTAFAGAPEIGRCVLKAGGSYKDSGCTKSKVNGPYQWEGFNNSGFKLTGGSTQLKWPGGTMNCATASGFGAWLSAKEDEEELDLSGCQDGAKECGTSGLPGEVLSNPLTGVLVWENRSTLNADLDLHGSPVMLEFSCGPEGVSGSVYVQLQGSVLARVEAGSMQLQPEELYVEAGGKQSPAAYVTSGFFGSTVRDVPEAKSGAEGTCVNIGSGGRWGGPTCSAETMPPNRGEWCKVPEAKCLTTGSAEEAVLTISNMTEEREEPLEINNVRGSAGHILLLAKAGSQLPDKAAFQLAGPVVLTANGEPIDCNNARMEGAVEENGAKKDKTSFGEFTTTGSEEGGACSSKAFGPVLLTWSGTPFTMELKSSKGAGAASLKGTKRVAVKAVFPLDAGMSCTYEASKLAASFPTLLPMDVTFTEQVLKRGKASKGECPAVVSLSADLNVTSEGQQVEAELE